MGRGPIPHPRRVLFASCFFALLSSLPPSLGFHILSPISLAGSYPFAAAAFGNPYATYAVDKGPLAEAVPFDGCRALANAEVLNGTMVLVKRGGCSFVNKAKNAQKAGAVGVVIVNNDPNKDFPKEIVPGKKTLESQELFMMADDGYGQGINLRLALVTPTDGITMLDHLRECRASRIQQEEAEGEGGEGGAAAVHAGPPSVKEKMEHPPCIMVSLGFSLQYTYFR